MTLLPKSGKLLGALVFTMSTTVYAQIDDPTSSPLSSSPADPPVSGAVVTHHPGDLVEDFLNNGTGIVIPASGPGFADHDRVQAAAGDIVFSVICTDSDMNSARSSQRTVRVELSKRPAEGFDRPVVNTIIGAAQTGAVEQCPQTGSTGYEVGQVDVYGPLAGDPKAMLYEGQDYSNSGGQGWRTFDDIENDKKVAFERDARLKEESEKSGEAEALAQNQAAAELAQQEQQRDARLDRVAEGILLLSILGIVLWIINKITHDAELRRQAQQREQQLDYEQRQRKWLAYVAEQKGYQNEINGLCSASIDAFNEIPRCLMGAEDLLGIAEKDFADRAFAPFWDTIERVVKHIGDANKHLAKIQSAVARYNALIKLCDATQQRFPVSPDLAKRLVVGDITSARLKKVVRTAQCDYRFASIYEQRRTNQLLLSGFNNLNDAVAGLSHQLSSSLKDVCNRIDDVGAGIREMERGWRDAHSDLSKALSEQSAQQAKEASEQRHRELLQVDQAKSALEMLDNIQNRRKTVVLGRPYPSFILTSCPPETYSNRCLSELRCLRGNIRERTAPDARVRAKGSGNTAATASVPVYCGSASKGDPGS